MSSVSFASMASSLASKLVYHVGVSLESMLQLPSGLPIHEATVSNVSKHLMPTCPSRWTLRSASRCAIETSCERVRHPSYRPKQLVQEQERVKTHLTETAPSERWSTKKSIMFGQHNGLSSLSALREDELQLREVFLVLDQGANVRAFAQVLLEASR